MKKNAKIFIPVIISSLLFTGCGSNDEKGSSYTQSAVNNNYASYEEAPMESAEEMADGESNSDTENIADEKEHNISEKVIKKEMLVYSCNLVVDVLDFDTAMNTFRNSLEVYNAFPENENYNNGSDSGRWIYEDNDQFKTYNATIRVPSKDYEQFCNDTANLGDLKNKNAHVDNLTAEYNDLTTTLEIYENRKDRLVEMLENAKDDQTIITLEKELADIQVDISTLENRINKIQTDVAYSFVNVTINEVREFEEEPVIEEKEDTFGERLSATVEKSTKAFLTLMEKLLFLVIYLLPYTVIIVFAVILIVAISKKIRHHKEENRQQYQYPTPITNPMPQNPVPVEEKKETENTENSDTSENK